MESVFGKVWESLPNLYAEISNRLKLHPRPSHPNSVFICLSKTFEGLAEFPTTYVEISKAFLADGINRLKLVEIKYLTSSEDVDEDQKVYKDSISLLVNLLSDIVRRLSTFQRSNAILPEDGLELAILVENLLKINLQYLKDTDICCLKNVITSCKVCWDFLKITKPFVLLSEMVPLQIRIADSLNLNEITDNMLMVLRCLTELTSEVNVSLSFVLNSIKADNPYYLSIKATATQFATEDQIVKMSNEEEIFCHLRNALKSADTKLSKLSTFIIQSFTAFYGSKNDFSSIPCRKNSQLLLDLHKPAFVKYWINFFDLFEVFEEKQIHIIRPFFSKLKEIELNSPAAVEWYFVILYKMLQHDNRGVAKEGAERFLEFSKILKDDDESGTTESQFLKFIEETLFPILQEQVGWIFKEGGEFFRYADRIGSILSLICNKIGKGKFFVTNKIMEIIQKAEKGLSAHFLYFLVLTLDSAVKGVTTQDEVILEMDSTSASDTFKLIVRCLNYSMATIDKFMRSEIEKKLMGIFEVLLNALGDLESYLEIQDTIIAFIGGLGKVFYRSDGFQELKNFPLTFTELTTDLIHGWSLNQLRGLLRWNLLSIARVDRLETKETAMKNLFGFCLKINGLKHWSPVTVAATEDIFKGLHALRAQTVGLQFSNYGFSDSVHQEISKILKNVLIVIFINGVNSDNFLNIVKSLNTIKLFCKVSEAAKISIIESINILAKRRKYVFKFGSSNIKDFLLCEVYLFFVDTCGVRRDHMPGIECFEKFFLSGNVTNDPNFVKNEPYLETFKENLACTYYQLKFRMFTVGVKKNNMYDGPAPIKIEPYWDSWEKYISVGLDNMDLVGQSGVVAAAPFFYECSHYVEHLDVDEVHKDRLAELILRFVEISWKNMDEQRKTENFWKSFKAIVDFMTSSTSIIKTEHFQKFVHRTFECKDIMGMSLVLMDSFKKSWKQSFVCLGLEYNGETQKLLYRNILNMCVSAASFGPPMVNTLTVDFNLWEVLITENSASNLMSAELLNTNHFHSASQTRILALMFIQMILKSVQMLPEGTIEFEVFLKDVIDKLLQDNEEESLNRKRYFNNSSSHRRKQRIAQSLVVLQYLFTKDIRRHVTMKLLDSLANDSSQASVRYLMEWVIIRNLTCDDQDWDLFFEESVKGCRAREGFGAFFATICLHTAKLLENGSNSKIFFEKALKQLVDLLLGKHFTVKVYSLISFLKIYEIAEGRDWTSVIEPVKVVYNSLRNVSQTGNFAKIHQNIVNDFYISIFDAESNYNYPMIFIHLPRILGMANDEIIPEPSLNALCNEFEQNFGSKLTSMPNLKCAPELGIKFMEYQKSVWQFRPVVDGRELMEMGPNDASLKSLSVNDASTDVNLQKKLNPWKFLPVGDDISDFKEELQLRKSSLAEDGLIVVASLIDRPPNLGGLCRTCEIFGVSKYVISSLKIQDDIEFKNLSVSAHNWVDLLEVPVKDLEIFLASYASKGYILIGVEQATESTKLQSYKFPKKSLLLLGNEKFGIPTNLLHLLNQCLEIPQVGVVRSLNVHVTGALCIYEYASQHVM